ncbi:hypothetical protein TNIN_354891 [Trichonephila inaurata madagascariensis]|uniref:Uncharacterized protein n=1 Tax=Trichonephila inaurata madagascariensis TaxID=2747483 RepID=A0A8X6IHI6_9ARAC|nr:hypothetical protein TNIN_354891 [Trichonephila inaurata madagascariensis]
MIFPKDIRNDIIKIHRYHDEIIRNEERITKNWVEEHGKKFGLSNDEYDPCTCKKYNAIPTYELRIKEIPTNEAITWTHPDSSSCPHPHENNLKYKMTVSYEWEPPKSTHCHSK